MSALNLKKQKTFNLLTACSGVGSAEMAAMQVWSNLSVIGACEIDKFARIGYEANYNVDAKHYHHDITKMDGTQYKGKTDCFVVGFPCQPFSNAGKRLGFEDTRGTIFYDCVRLVKEAEPEMFIFENVDGLVGHGKEKDIKKTIKEVTLLGEEEKEVLVKKATKYFSKKNPEKEIGRTLSVMEDVLDDTGYFWTWKVLNTKDFGVPQNRKRIFFVGFKNKEAFDKFEFPEPEPLTKRLKDVLEDDVDEKYYLSQSQLDGFKLQESGKSIKVLGNTNPSGRGMNGEVISVDGLSSALTTNKGEGIKVAGKLDVAFDSNSRVHDPSGISPTLTTMQGGGQEPKILTGGCPDSEIIQRGRGFNRGGVHKISPTITCNSWQENNFLTEPKALRMVRTEEGKRVRKKYESGEIKHGFNEMRKPEPRNDGCTNTLTGVQKDNYVLVPSATKSGYETAKNFDSINLTFMTSKTRRGRVGKQVSQTLDTSCNIGVLLIENQHFFVRKLTPRECFRLQGFPDTFKFVVSNSQLYKQAGNSKTVTVVEKIMKNAKLALEGLAEGIKEEFEIGGLFT